MASSSREVRVGVDTGTTGKIVGWMGYVCLAVVFAWMMAVHYFVEGVAATVESIGALGSESDRPSLSKQGRERHR